MFFPYMSRDNILVTTCVITKLTCKIFDSMMQTKVDSKNPLGFGYIITLKTFECFFVMHPFNMITDVRSVSES